MIATDRHRPQATSPKPLSLSLLIAVLAIGVTAYAVSIAPAAWPTAAQSTLGSEQPTLFQCATIANDVDRHGCYDRLDRETLRPPAKGAYAPFGAATQMQSP